MKIYHTLSCLGLLVCCAVVSGCGPSHRAVPVLEAGRDLHLTVKLPGDQVSDARGAVYYSVPAGGGFESRAMALQGTNLTATLATAGLGPGTRVAYYFDVFAGGEAKSLGTAQRPYVTEILDRVGVIQRSLRCDVRFAEPGKPVVFKLDAGGLRVSRAVVRYSPPDLPGVVEQVMVRRGRVWEAEVPGKRVSAGAWTYRIEAQIEGATYTHPDPSGKADYFTIKGKKK